ncbi:MAG: NAD-dependent epimerase/dehydratase family protein [Phycisphaerae bacterium]|nr:NAD-dependent epimerase/dehydratase family protein [Phycisphaerae bacterium]
MTAQSPTNTPGGGAPQRALITGGAGFIGSHLCERLLARGDAVTIVDDLSTGRRANLPPPHPNLRFIEADLKEALRALGRGERFHEIYHLAAAVGVDLVLKDPFNAIRINIEQTQAVLDFALHASPAGGPTRILVASSSEVYGKGICEPFAEDDDVVLGPTTLARWSYAHSKAIDEHLAIACARHRGLPATIVRFFNTVGPRQVGQYGMVLPRFIRAALEGRPLEVFGDGRQSRCFCDVRDVVAALPMLLASPACAGRVFNLGSDRPITIEELACLVIRVTGSRSEVRFVPYDKAYPEGFEDLRARRPDLTRIRQAIGFSPSIPLERTVRDTAASVAADAARPVVDTPPARAPRPEEARP